MPERGILGTHEFKIRDFPADGDLDDLKDAIIKKKKERGEPYQIEPVCPGTARQTLVSTLQPSGSTSENPIMFTEIVDASALLPNGAGKL